MNRQAGGLLRSWGEDSHFREMPWFNGSFRLISWLEMLQFSAHKFLNISGSLEWIRSEDEKFVSEDFKRDGKHRLERFFENVSRDLNTIGCRVSSSAALRLAGDLMGMDSPIELNARVRELRSVISDEMKDQLFLWCPSHRANYYSKDAESVLGADCCARFPSVQREVDEAMKCYALGRFTASGFHITRAGEAGVQALARAINFIPKCNNWTLVFRQLGNEHKLPEDQRPAHWKTHGGFLEMVWADLRAVSKVWRNDIAHLVATYSEDEAKTLLDLMPVFLRDLATKMDEEGTLY